MKEKAYIARDTGEPLTVLGGYRVRSDGGLMSIPVDLSVPPGPPPPTDADRALLEKHGEDGLRRMKYFGVLDRLHLLKEGDR